MRKLYRPDVTTEEDKKLKSLLASYIIIALMICVFWFFLLYIIWPAPAKAGQRDLERIGLGLVQKSLNKRVVVTPRQSWTEYQPGRTGVEYRVIICPRGRERDRNERRQYSEANFGQGSQQVDPFCRP